MTKENTGQQTPDENVVPKTLDDLPSNEPVEHFDSAAHGNLTADELKARVQVSGPLENLADRLREGALGAYAHATESDLIAGADVPDRVGESDVEGSGDDDGSEPEDEQPEPDDDAA
jgi:hypothetical protein